MIGSFRAIGRLAEVDGKGIPSFDFESYCRIRDALSFGWLAGRSIPRWITIVDGESDSEAD